MKPSLFNFFFCLFLLAPLSIYSQDTVKISLSNPVPRVGTQVGVDCKFPYTWPDTGKALKPERFTLNKTFTDTGITCVGPFSISINRQQYFTDSLCVKVYPKLPPVNEGIWIIQAHYNGTDFIVVEQRIPAEWEKNGSHTSVKEKNVVFAEPDAEKFSAAGLTAWGNYSIRSSGHVTENYSTDSDPAYYRCVIYTISKDAAFKGPAVITKSFFKDFPKKQDMNPVTIH